MKTTEEINKLAEKFVSQDGRFTKTSLNQTGWGFAERGFIEGYSECQEENSEKMKMIIESLLKIRDCKDYGNNSSTIAKELIESLNK